jgi:S-DNA-T family DNA segregation ATPase FtsK/SpoIIIE
LKANPSEPPRPLAEKGDWLERIARFQLHFGRYIRDAIGVLLVAVALMALLATWGDTGGALLRPAAVFASTWLGWGTLLLVAALTYGGAVMISRRPNRPRWGRVLALELAGLFSLALLSMLGGNSLVRADAGMDGGRLGWGIAYLSAYYVGPIWGTVVVTVAWATCVVVGFGVWDLGRARLVALAGEPLPSSPEEPDDILTDADTSEQPKLNSRKDTPVGMPPVIRPARIGGDRRSGRSSKLAPRPADLPPLGVLQVEQAVRQDERTINQTAGLIMRTLAEFGIPATVIGYRVGPAVTQFAIQPGFIKRPGASDDDEAQQMKVRVAQIANLQKDLALALSAERLRIEAPVPGKPYVGIEVPNAHSAIVRLRPILESEAFQRNPAPLTIALGRDVSGNPIVADLARMPHLLIAGATGSGKSVCITSIAACLAMNNTPEDLRLIMIDSKMVELLRFNGLPHLYGRVETNIDRILGVLRWVVLEMEHRYRLLEEARARDLNGYNRKRVRKGNGSALPRLVVLIDELADLMMSAPDQTEHNLVRLAQMARATGIHLVVATQRPSTDVVTGVIKANFPARLAFAVTSGVDSRVILDVTGAETLLGRGDMLFLHPEVGTAQRAQGVLVTDTEIERIIDHWQTSVPSPEGPPPWERLLEEPEDNADEGLVEQAISLVRNAGRASASLLQRRLRIGYPRAARLLDQLEQAGIVGPSQGGGREREVLPFETEIESED